MWFSLSVTVEIDFYDDLKKIVVISFLSYSKPDPLFEVKRLKIQTWIFSFPGTFVKEDISQETNIAFCIVCFIHTLFEIEYGGNSLYIDGYSWIGITLYFIYVLLSTIRLDM